MKIRLHNFLDCSYANGPGARAVIWVQGCRFHCPGCFNPKTHSFTEGKWIEIIELSKNILKLGSTIEGVTISGGEPLAQPSAIFQLLTRLRSQSDLSVVLLTGYSWGELRCHSDLIPSSSFIGMPALLQFVDVLIAGRYDQRQHLANGLRGSANKSIHYLTNRYKPADFESIPAAEIILETDGHIIQSGISPANLNLDKPSSTGGMYA